MSDTESVDYLQTGFDPASLTVPRIRSILVAHDIEYPSGAKKPQLIQIFNDNILPQARKLLSARARVRRISKGIVDADSQDSSLADEELMPPPPTPRVRSRKTPSRTKSEESEPEGQVSRSPTKRTPRASSKHARPSESETGTDLEGTVKKAARIARKSLAPAPSPAPEIKDEESEDEIPVSRVAPRRQSAFTYDNPFQSGSSPLDAARLASGEKKRKSLGSTGKDPSRRKSTVARRRTDGPTSDDDFHPPTSSTFEIPVSKLNGLIDVDENGVVADEEFTPEAQLELTREVAAKGASALGPSRPRRQPRGFSWKGPLSVLALAFSGGWAAYYRQEKLAVGYCGVGREATQVFPTGINVPDWARILVEPECELCPQHAYCSDNLETHCEADFILKPHPLSVAGVVPLPPTCEPNGEKVRRVNAVAQRAVEELRDRRAKSECREVDAATGTIVTAEVDAEDLKTEIGEKRKKGMSEAEFEELWGAAIGEIKGRDEVEVVTVADGNRRLLSSTSLAKLPFGCAVRRSFRLALGRHFFKLVSVTLLVASYFYAKHHFASRKKASAAIPNLVALTLERLALQATLHAQDKEGVPENWISIGQLRDDVLRSEHSLRKREAVWQNVKRVVEMNSNVRAGQREGRNGEVSRVWEWIGALGDLDSGERRRKSGRVSWGVYDERSSPVSGSDGGPEVVQQKWQEGRPIY